MEVEETPTPIRMAREACLKPQTEYRLIATTSASGTHTAELRLQKGTSLLTSAAHGLIGIVPLQPFHNQTFNILAIAIHRL